jgi:hypothetical protein
VGSGKYFVIIFLRQISRTISIPQVAAESEKDKAPEVLEAHLFKAFRGVAAQRADHCERTVFLIKKSAIEIIDGDYEAPGHKHAFVGETRVPEAGCLRIIGRVVYKLVKSWFR